MINCLIVDDEPLARNVIRHHLATFPGWHVVAECEHVAAALEALIANKVQVVFLDIQMPRILGTDFLRSLKDPPKIIFTTAHAGFAVEGFELNAVDYLLKPVTLKRFSEAICKVEALLGHGNTSPELSIAKTVEDDFIFIRQENRQVKLLFADILFMEARRDFTLVQLTNRKVLAGFHLKMLEGMLPASRFMRVHRSYIVKLEAIQVVFGNTVEISGFQVPVSAAHKEALTAALKI